MNRFRIVVAVRELVREVLLHQLTGREELEVVDEVMEPARLLPVLEAQRPDFLLLDARFPLSSGIESLAAIREIRPRIRILLIFGHSDCRQAWLSEVNDHWECQLISSPLKDCPETLQALCSEKLPQSYNDLEELFAHSRESATSGTPDAGSRIPLTKREQEIVRCVRQGMSNKEIARRLGISDLTVKTHLQHIYAKRGIHGRLLVALR